MICINVTSVSTFSTEDFCFLEYKVDLHHMLDFLTFQCVYLLHEEDDDFSEDLHEVNEEVQRVADEILISHSPLVHNNLSVPHNEAAEKEQTSPQVDLEEKNVD